MTATTDALSHVYALSLFQLAEEADGNDKVLEIADELEQICELIRSNRELATFFASPVIDVERRSASLVAIFSDRLTDLVLRFLIVLNQKGRLGHLESISTAYDALLQEAFGRVEVDVFTAQPMAAADMEGIKVQMASALGKEPVLHPYVDKAMLGGIKLRIGDQLIDGSVSTRLRRLGEDLTKRGRSSVRETFERFMDDAS